MICAEIDPVTSLYCSLEKGHDPANEHLAINWLERRVLARWQVSAPPPPFATEDTSNACWCGTKMTPSGSAGGPVTNCPQHPDSENPRPDSEKPKVADPVFDSLVQMAVEHLRPDAEKPKMEGPHFYFSGSPADSRPACACLWPPQAGEKHAHGCHADSEKPHRSGIDCKRTQRDQVYCDTCGSVLTDHAERPDSDREPTCPDCRAPRGPAHHCAGGRE